MIQKAFEICLAVMLAEIVLAFIMTFTILLIYSTSRIIGNIMGKLWNEKKEFKKRYYTYGIE